MHSTEKQVGGVVGGGAEKPVLRRLPDDVADRKRARMPEPFRPGSVEEVGHPSLLHSQRGDQGEYRRKVQSNSEKTHAAILYETSDDAVHRRASGL